MITYLKEVFQELKKVEWPSKEEVIKFTTIVIAFTLSMAFFLGIWDSIFEELIKIVIKK